MEDEIFREYIKETIKQEITLSHDSPSFTWELLKLIIRGKTIQYAVNKNIEQSNKLQALTEEAKQLEIQIN